MDIASLDAALETPFSLAGRRILVTGAAGGIGIAAAQVCHAQGADLLLTDIVSEDKARARLVGVPADLPYFTADLSDRAQVDALAGRTGSVYAVIDTAGLCPQDDWTAEGWDDAFDTVIGANVKGPINLARAYMPGMMASGGGRLALCGSVSGRMGGLVCGPHYAASKGGVHSLVRWLAQKGARHNILVNAVAPGSVDTPMASANNVPTDDYPLGRRGRPKELGATLAFLCSPAAGFMSGAVLDVNGATYFG
jgi:NAD(P)-dependent dehydrogenase (short-subunit alcohol dehydrogenase family)